MAPFQLTESEADRLMNMPKHRKDDLEVELPDLGGKVSVPLVSADRREEFLLDVSRGRIDLLKVKYQNRVRQTVVLARLDLGGVPHRNPDGQDIATPHLHLYQEGYADKWAWPLSAEHFSNPRDVWDVLQDFMRYCKVIVPPNFQRGLFT